MVREIFRNKETTEFVIVTIPTVSNFRIFSYFNVIKHVISNFFARQCSSFGWFFLQVMAISESSRLKSSLEKGGVPVKRLIVNQVLPPSNSDCKFCAVKRKVCLHKDFETWSVYAKRVPLDFLSHLLPSCSEHITQLLPTLVWWLQDQKKAMDLVSEDANLKTLEIVQSPLFDLEIRGVPALKFMGDLVWRWCITTGSAYTEDLLCTSS